MTFMAMKGLWDKEGNDVMSLQAADQGKAGQMAEIFL